MSQLLFRAEIVLTETTANTADPRNHAVIWAQATAATTDRQYPVRASCSIETTYSQFYDRYFHVVVFSGIQVPEHRDAGIWRSSVRAAVDRVKVIYGVTDRVSVFFSTGFTEQV